MIVNYGKIPIFEKWRVIEKIFYQWNVEIILHYGIKFNKFISIVIFLGKAFKTNQNCRKGDILWRDPFDVGNLIVVVVVGHCKGNVMSPESENDQNQRNPDQF